MRYVDLIASAVLGHRVQALIIGARHLLPAYVVVLVCGEGSAERVARPNLDH